MSTELKEVVQALGGAFDEFKSANDERIKQIEAKGSADHILADKVDRMNAAIGELGKEKARLDTIEAALNRGDLGGGGGANEEEKAKEAYSKAFGSYFRKGQEAGLRDLSLNAALTTQVDEDGGYVVAPEIDTAISRELTVVSAMRGLARVRTIGTDTFKRYHNVGGSTSGWVGEEQSRNGTDTPKLKEIAFSAMELYAEPSTTQQIVDDANLDIAAWLADEVGIEFAEQEGSAFIVGSDPKKPRGLLSYDAVANGSESFGQLGFIKSGANGGFATNPGDKLIDLVHSLKAGYRGNASWLMNDLTLAEVRKFKDADGNYIWKAGLVEGAPDTLLGKPVNIDDNMPDIAANSLSIAFGDFKRGYLIVDRMGVRVLRDDLTSKGFVKYYTTKRVGGGLNDSNAIKLMKFAA